MKVNLSEKRLYHFIKPIILVFCLVIITAGCQSAVLDESTPRMEISVEADNQSYSIALPKDSTVQNVLEAAGIVLEGSDRVEPPLGVVLSGDDQVNVIRVEEVIEIEEETIPYRVIEQPTENLPVGQEQLLQSGKNGLREVTYLRVFENGQESSFREISSVEVEAPVDEMILVGVRASSSPVAIPSPLIYISSGNAWLMEQSTSNRTLLVGTGDLDGRVFKISPDREWLLFTRTSAEEDVINTLWAAKIEAQGQVLVDLKVNNVIHFADWVPDDESSVAYSTVESRISAPGWQANNNLEVRKFSESGWSTISYEVLETGYIGVYGWWGTEFSYSPSGEYVAYASPDQVGIVDVESGERESYLEMPPYRTSGDWAWMSGLGVGPLGNFIYAVEHVPLDGQEGTAAAEESPKFDLTAISLATGISTRILEDVGMFAYPIPSPIQGKTSGEASFQVAYLQAVFPEQSSTSNYRVAVMDRDGSNPRVIFPPPDKSGLEPRRGWGTWSPEVVEGSEGQLLAVLYSGNIWILDPNTGVYNQVTGDGRVQALDW